MTIMKGSFWIFSLLLMTLGACARKAEDGDGNPTPTTRTAVVSEDEILRYCIGNKQIVNVSGANEAEKTRVVEGIFKPNTVINRIEGPVTYCLLMKPNDQNSRFDAFLRIEVESQSGTTSLPYRSLQDAFYADVFYGENGDRIVNAIFYDDQGVVEVYARGTDAENLSGDITYANFMTFNESLDKAMAEAEAKAKTQKPAQNIYFANDPFAGYPLSDEAWFYLLTDMLDGDQAVKLGDIKLDLMKSLEQ